MTHLTEGLACEGEIKKSAIEVASGLGHRIRKSPPSEKTKDGHHIGGC